MTSPTETDLMDLAAEKISEEFSEELSESIPEEEQQTAEEISEKQLFEEQAAAAERAQAEMEERDREFLASLDRVLERQRTVRKEPQTEQAITRFALGVVRKGVGVISMSLILIIMGIAMICCLFSSAPDYLLPMKLSPIAAVLLGLELLAYYVTSKANFRVHIPSICISAAVVVGCCFMCTTLNSAYSEQKTEYNNRTIAAEIYDRSYKELRYVADISTLSVNVDLTEGINRSEGIESLGAGDVVSVSVELGGQFSSPSGFAQECKDIIDGYRILGIPVDNFHFMCESTLHSFSLDVEGKFAQDYSESRLAEMVSCIYIEDYDYIADLEDFIDTSDESGEGE